MAEGFRPDSDAELDGKIVLFGERVRVASNTLLESAGQIIRNDIQNRLSEPYPPASAAMEDPHLRTGSLRDGVEYSLSEVGEGVEMSITVHREPTVASSDPNAAVVLEFGNGQIEPRMYMTRAMADWPMDLFLDEYRSELAGALTP